MINYSHTIGIASFEGRGFMNPVDLALDNEGLLYVLSRSNAVNQDVRVSVQTTDSEYKHEFGRWGTEPGQTILPSSIAIDKRNHVYVSDEFMHNISVFHSDGTFIERWGELGSEPGHFNRPSGIRFDMDGNIVVVDHLNSRVQKFDSRGNLLSHFGTFGYDDGQFNYPWGLCVDALNNIWIADWRNDRIQVFNQDGEFLFKFGVSGSEKSQFSRPSGVHVSDSGHIYVSDWRNNRIQIFDGNQNWVKTLYGDATLSKWCKDFLDVNPEQASWRENAALFEQEKRFWLPTAVMSSPDGNIFVADSCRHRIQIYKESPVLSKV